MASKKQRRRRAKEQRHDYVWVDGEGNELDAPAKEGDEPRSRSRQARGKREPQAPSWNRTLKRGLIFAPIMFAHRSSHLAEALDWRRRSRRRF